MPLRSVGVLRNVKNIIKDPVDFMEENRIKLPVKNLPKDRPWPFNRKEVDKSRMDPNYREEKALIYNRRAKLYEGYKGVLNFTNSIIESDQSLPETILNNAENLILDDEIISMLERQLKWSDKLDSLNERCNGPYMDYPRLNKYAVPEFGPTLDRKELNVLLSYADCSELLIAKNFGHLYYPRILSPNYILGFIRDNKRCILDLRCDFITLKQNSIDEFLKSTDQQQNSDDSSTKNHQQSLLFSENVENTKHKPLIDINPLNWEINFDTDHFYPTDELLNKPTKVTEQNVDTVYLGNNFNIHKPIPDRIIKGKLLLHLYGYAVGRARYLYGQESDYQNEANYQVFEKPITIKGVYANYSKRNLGFACLQLNTLSYDSEIKNQVWFDGPYDVIDDQEIIVQKLALMNLNSYQTEK